MTEYTYSIHIQVEHGKPVDYWCEYEDESIGLPRDAWAAIIGHACQDWQERRQELKEAFADAKREHNSEAAK